MTYADDTQLYAILKHPQTNTLRKIEHCIDDIKAWAVMNKLVLNDNKTEVLHIHSRFRNPEPLHSIRVGQSDVNTVPEARNLGVIFDEHLCSTSHVNSICKAAFLAIRNIGTIRGYLDKSATERLVHAFITSRLDNCNSLLYGLPSRLISEYRTQLLVLSLEPNVPNVLKDLHWLPVRLRINFKILLLTYKSLHGLAPLYLSELIQPYKPIRSLRSQSKHLLLKTKTKLVNYGDRAFSAAAAVLWNDLPAKVKEADSLEHFKNLLKTYLFTFC